jgi:3beta-hydroxy-delta5-steroid dehydrogenase/steroid delta-isomerase
MTEPERPDRIPMDLDLPIMEGSEVGEGFETTDLGYCLVTGAAGFLGRQLVFELIRRGEHVRAFDCVDLPYGHERLDFVKGDVRRFENARKACERIDTVFHTAAVLDFRGFATREQRDRSYSVNVLGVENVVQASVEAGVKRLVHTSSNNVTFGSPVIDGDETDAYAPDPKDLYTETKILGEKAALAGNGRGRLLTCAIRPGGIYGPGDHLVLPRIVEECASGKFVVTIGDGRALSDNTYIDNLVDGEIEAARHLIPGSRLCGEAYFITDGDPINYFDFFRPLVEEMGFEFPKVKMPAWLLYGMMSVWEFLHWAVKIPPPLLTRLEVRKITVSHYSRIEKAKRDFGWTPKVSMDAAGAKCAEYCKELLEKRIQQMQSEPGSDVGSRAIRRLRDLKESREEFAPPNHRGLLAAITAVHRFLYLKSGGLVGSRLFWIRFLLLIHVGQKTGRTRFTPLLYVEDGDRWVVVASNGGDDQHPGWWHNLQSRPEAQIQVGRQRIDVSWRHATSEECDDLWPKLAASYPYFPKYRKRTQREIPIVILERVTERGTNPYPASTTEAIAP